ncbi:chromosome segregation protein SMC [Gynuella sunshinyii]|uniref:Chromosome partition protein Smc n=1 Tax=Gynuella sunshinyii YC6258 TaxID=1445510 RepID=A0A0C5VQ54_9GAMM|nr:chromosome segregation protein SMC [Gynuella sunshinyii]AJQ96717.1 chromosome segregation ATPase [Gynuella sunshinyii YC6258]
MRLKCIKLAGFKSFVDPTTIPFPTNMTAIVGPNGCGKSNTIDAVRWVMGESSAKHLRGESMTDVIFNGSNNRKPVGQCSVELVFDNHDGKAPGEYAKYAEISVRRKVTRDGQSNYFLNGTKCRRKDITDLFLGTGLGARSYAIIEQGMISRLIEAKPEELRVYVEEAAGISKYKERRKETESRMRRTQENLERLTDIRDELERQLQHLHRQALAAEKYTELKKEERERKAQLSAIRWQRLDEDAGQREMRINELETEYEKYVAEQRSIDAQVEELRDSHNDRTEVFNQVQSQYYQLGTEIARFEQSMQHQKEKAAQLQTDLIELDRSLQETSREKEEDQFRLEEIEEQLMIAEPELEMARAAEEEAQEALVRHEQSMQQWQQKWELFNQDSAGPKQTAEVAQSRIQHLEQVIDRINRRLSSLYQERDGLLADPEAEAIEELLMQTEEAEQSMETQQRRFDDLSEQLESSRTQLEDKRTRLNDAQRRQTQIKGRQATLEALQQAAMGEAGGGVQRWLESHQLQHRERLAQQVHVRNGWDKAVETVLGAYLQAVCVDSTEALTDGLARFEQGMLNLIDQTATTASSQSGYLNAEVDSRYDLSDLLDRIRIAEDLPAAMAMRSSLQAGESVVTRDGIWLGRNWLRISKDSNDADGILSRQTELEEIEIQLDELDASVEELEVDVEVVEMRVRSLNEEREQAQRELGQLARQYADFKSRLSGKQAQAEQMRNRRQQLLAEISEQETHLAEERENMAMSREELQIALDAMEEGTEERENLMQEREQLRQAVDEARDMSRSQKDKVHSLALQHQASQAKADAIKTALERLDQQLARLQEKREMLLMQKEEQLEPDNDLQIELETKLEQRLELEQKVADARAEMEAIDSKMRELDSQRHRSEGKAMEVRSKLEQARMESQTVITRRTTLQEQLQEASFDLETVLANLPENASEEEWEQELEQINQKIQRLGAINLAAIDEYKIQSERKTYLDAQNDDLQKALETLENAIVKIDRETRNRFKETFDRVNGGLQDLFPKVFGGGHAYLELTGEDLLDTGVAIMARPPGKKNSTIHLLSGGEKALTAIALVFSIFKLNPAPFCMLDEVDAPLDDANVGRYARLVDAMSEHVQFIYITHNKIAMEMAKDLMGVTMNEPGVSRLVSVNVEEAAELAAI